jgi:large subunit ribosomal protein L3
MARKGILGRKVGMTQVFDSAGKALPVTVIEAGPCHVLLVRTQERDGYSAVQLGFKDKPRRLASRAERGQVASLGSVRGKKRQDSGVAVGKKAECEPKRFVRELRGDYPGVEVGATWTVQSLEGVKAVDVVGVTKGRGFSGVIKRHGFGGQRATHGVKKVHRHMGGTGSLAAWRGGGRPKKGKRMPGHYGCDQVTSRNLDVVRIDADSNLILVRGAVPGPPGGYVVIHETNKVG